MKKILLSLALLPLSAFAQNIHTIAGNGIAGDTGDGTAATTAQINNPSGVVFDTAGNLYIADYGSNKIKKVSVTTGHIATYAGTGIAGYSGDGFAATAAQLSGPTNITIDKYGNLYVAEFGNHVIRKVTPAGVISTVAGNNSAISAGDGMPATAASINHPSSIVFDTAGNLYIAESWGKYIRKVNTAGVISTFAGNGMGGGSGDGGPATAASVEPWQLAIDKSGNLYEGDAANNKIRKISPAGVITTVAGNGTAGYSGDGAAAAAAQLHNPAGIAVDTLGNLYIADQFNNAIRKVTTTGVISTIAGNGTAGYSGDGGPATAAELQNANSLTIGKNGYVYFCDDGNNRVRSIGGFPLQVADVAPPTNWDIYPNPASNELVVKFAGDNAVKLMEVYNTVGMKVLAQVVSQSEVAINISELPGGVYFIAVAETNKLSAKKFIKK